MDFDSGPKWHLWRSPSRRKPVGRKGIVVGCRWWCCRARKAGSSAEMTEQREWIYGAEILSWKDDCIKLTRFQNEIHICTHTTNSFLHHKYEWQNCKSCIFSKINWSSNRSKWLPIGALMAEFLAIFGKQWFYRPPRCMDKFTHNLPSDACP